MATSADEPSEALVEAVAEAIHRSQDGWPLAWADLHEDAQAAYLDEARVAFAAMVEHLGLVEDWAVRFERHGDPTMDNPSGVVTVEQRVEGEVHARACVKNGAPISGKNRRVVRRLVSKWETVP